MECRHCKTSFHDSYNDYNLSSDKDGQKGIRCRRCPECKRFILSILSGGHFNNGQHVGAEKEVFVYPRGSSRSPVPQEVSDEHPEIAEDYSEAGLVLADSSKASAALGRRCLQNLLHSKAGIKKATLDAEINEILAAKLLPTHLAESIDAIRVIGNFAAHPIKGQSSGEIVPVEMGEAEWILDVLEGLFDFYYVQPAILKKKRDEMNKKLADAGKPPLK